MNNIKYVELHGERIAYREAGQGETVVLLHGMASSSDIWEPVISRLGVRFRVIAPDLLGHGHSTKPRTDYSLGAFAAGLRDLFDELGIRQATIVGHSLGGGIAMQVLYQHPEYCRRPILVSSGGLGPDVGWILRLLAAPGAEFMLPLAAPKVVLNIGNRLGPWLNAAGLRSRRAGPIWAGYNSLSDGATRAAFVRTLRSVVDYRGQSVSALSRLQMRTEVPTLVIWGDRDAIIPVQHGYAVHAARPGSRLDVLPGLGHFPHVQSPTVVATAIAEFIDGSCDAIDGAAQVHSSLRRQASAAVEHRTLIDNLESRNRVEVAIGVLMGLRGCPQTEALSEFATAIHETGLSPAELAGALVDVASGNGTSPHRAQAQNRWRHLLALRGIPGGSNVLAKVNHSVRVRYGPENDATIC